MNIIDLYTEQGSTYSTDITLNDDITGYSIQSKVIDSSNTKFNATITINNYSTGSFTYLLPSYITSNMREGIARYDIELTDSEGNKSKVIKGRIYIDKEITDE